MEALHSLNISPIAAGALPCQPGGREDFCAICAKSHRERAGDCAYITQS